MGTIADKLNKALANKADIKNALIEKGNDPNDNMSTWGDEIRAIETGGVSFRVRGSEEPPTALTQGQLGDIIVVTTADVSAIKNVVIWPTMYVAEGNIYAGDAVILFCEVDGGVAPSSAVCKLLEAENASLTVDIKCSVVNLGNSQLKTSIYVYDGATGTWKEVGYIQLPIATTDILNLESYLGKGLVVTGVYTLLGLTDSLDDASLAERYDAVDEFSLSEYLGAGTFTVPMIFGALGLSDSVESTPTINFEEE